MYSNYFYSEELNMFKLPSCRELPLMGTTGKAVNSHQEHILTTERSTLQKCEYKVRVFFILFFFFDFRMVLIYCTCGLCELHPAV